MTTDDRAAQLTAARLAKAARVATERPLVNELARVRRARGLTQVELAERAGVSREAISFIERGVNTPTLRLALKLALALGSPVEAIFRLDE